MRKEEVESGMGKRIAGLQIWRRKPFIVITALFVLLFLILVIKLAMPNRSYRFEGVSRLTAAESPEGENIIYGGIALPVGSWHIELEYQTDRDLVNLCYLKDGSVYTGALLCNGEHMYSARTKTGFDCWLYESTRELQVAVSYNNSSVVQTGGLRITETNQLWTMLLTVLLFVTGVAYAVLAVYYYDKEYTIAFEKKKTFFFMTLFVFLASLPYLNGFNTTGADLTYHLQRIEGVKDGLLTGQFPVRIEPRWLYDHGYADGIFYCNTLLYFPALLRILGFTVSASYNIYCIVLTIVTAWIAYHCFSRIFRSSNVGLAGCALYLFSISRIYKLVVTTAVGEGSAAAFIPLAFYGLYRIFTEDTKSAGYRTAWLPLMLGYAGLIQTHVLTCEITALVTIIFCLLNIKRFLDKRVWFAFLKAAAGAAALSLWYLVPFLDYYLTQDVHIRHVSARTIQDRGLVWAQLAFHFWKDGSTTPDGVSGMQNSHPVGIGLVLIVALSIFLILWFSGAFRARTDSRTLFAKGTALTGVLLLIMSTNAFPWDYIQSLHPVAASLVSSLQFPNRFLGWGTVCLIMLFCYLLWYFGESKKKAACWAMAAVALFGVTTSGMYLLDYVAANQDYYELYNEESMGFGYISGAEYLIEGTSEELLSYAVPVASEGVSLGDYCQNGLRASLQCSNDTGEAGYVDLPILLYKGYRAYDEAGGHELTVGYGTNNVLRVELVAGYRGTILVRFVSPFYWRISEGITVAAAAGLLFMGWKRQLRKKKMAGEKVC